MRRPWFQDAIVHGFGGSYARLRFACNILNATYAALVSVRNRIAQTKDLHFEAGLGNT